MTFRLPVSATLTSLLLLGVVPAAFAQTILPPVTVTDTRRVESKIVADQEMIDREKPLTLKDLFKGAPEVQVTSGSTAAQKFYLHGIDQSKLNVTIDGVPQRAAVWHHNGNLSLDPMFLERVEVDPGVSPADAGPGGLGGAVRFKTKSAQSLLLPGQTVGGTLSASYSSNSATLRGTGAGYGAVQGFDLLGRASWARGENYKTGHGDEELGTKTNLKSGLVKLGHESESGHRVQLSAEHVVDDAVRRLRPNMGVVGNPTGRLFNSNKATRTTLAADYSLTRPTDWLAPEVSVYFNRAGLDRPNDSKRSTAYGAFNSDVETYGMKAQNSFAFSTGKLTLGVDYRQDDVGIERFHFPTDAREKVSNLGGFGQFRFAPLPDLSVSTGLRVDHQVYKAVDGQEFTKTGVSPNLSVEYKIAPTLTAFAGAAHTWGGLELAETGFFHAANYRYDPNLKATTAQTLRGGLRYEAGGLSLEGAVFQTIIENPVDYNFSTYTRLNGKTLKTRGFDLAAGYAWENARIGAKYTHNDVTYGGRMALPSDYNNGLSVGDLITLNAAYLYDPWRLTVGGSTEIALRVDDADLAKAGFKPLKSYTVVNAFVEWQPLASTPHWTLRLDATNLLDAAYSSRSTYSQTSAITPVLAEGRSVMLSTAIKF